MDIDKITVERKYNELTDELIAERSNNSDMTLDAFVMYKIATLLSVVGSQQETIEQLVSTLNNIIDHE